MKQILILILTCSLCINYAIAQTFNFSGTDNGSMICSSESADLLAAPGTESSLITIIYFGEEVEKLGEEAYVGDEERNYVKVRGADGKVGWVNEAYFVDRGGVVAIIRESRLYRRPNTISTATMDFFEPGEVVILIGTSKQWVNLISKGKEKTRLGSGTGSCIFRRR